MPLDPQAQALLAAFAQAPTIDFAQLTVPAYRASLAAGGAFAPGDAVAAEEDWRIPLSDRQLSARLYRPAADGPLPLTVFFHGGGFVSCGIDTHANPAAALPPGRARSCCRSTTGLRPRHASRRPRTTHATRCAGLLPARAISARAPVRLAVAGDSAGGNLAAVAAAVARLGHCDRAPVAAVSGRRLRDRASVVRNARQRLFPDGGRDALVQAPLFRRRRRSRVAARGPLLAGRRRRGAGDDHQRRIRSAARRGPKRMRCASRRPAPRWRSCAGRASFMVSRACSARSMQPTAC